MSRAEAQEVEQRLEDALDELKSGRGIEHAVLAVEKVNEGFAWAGARGDARPGGPPMTPGTPYYIASIDKLFTAVVTLRLHERGTLDINASIAEYLDRSIIEGLNRWQGRDLSEQITLRNLLSHTSGLANYLEDRPKDGRPLIDLLSKEGDRAWSLAQVAARVRDELRPHFPPQQTASRRQKIRYSDTNYALLHGVIESATGAELHAVFEEELFEPLRLDHTWMAGWPRAAGREEETASLWVGNRPMEIPLAMRSLHGIFSNSRDQLSFMRAYATEALFESPDTKRLMQAQWNRFGFPLDAAALRAPSWPIEYGLGVKRFALPRLLTGGKPIPPLFGHSGSTGTWLFHCPELDLLIAGAVDQVTAGALPYRFLPKVVRIFRN
ncbi:MAG TPA: serine hydrolase domain-containing protein [Trueperaceae bacterium]